MNQAFAKAFSPNSDPIGKRVTDTYPGNPADAIIVGVVADSKHDNLREEIQPRMYVPMFNPLWPQSGSFYEIRTAADPAAVAGALRAVMHDTNSAIPEVEIHTMPDSCRNRCTAIILWRVSRRRLVCWPSCWRE